MITTALELAQISSTLRLREESTWQTFPSLMLLNLELLPVILLLQSNRKTYYKYTENFACEMP